MATYYVRPDGSDSNNGASSSTTGAWATLNKALTVTSTSQNASGIVGGDIIYVAPGTYRRSAETAVAWTSPTSEVRVVGDPTGTLTTWTGGVTAGPVLHTTYSTNDNTQPTTTNLIDLAGRDYISFENQVFISRGHCFRNSTGTSTNIKFKNCRIAGDNVQPVYFTNGFGVPFDLTFERCILSCRSTQCIELGITKGTGSNYNINLTVDSCLLFSRTYSIWLYANGSGTNFGTGGVEIFNCWFSANWGIYLNQGTGVNAAKVRNCTFFHNDTAGIRYETDNEVSEDYNRFFHCGATLVKSSTGQTIGTNSKNGLDALDYGLMWNWGMNVLPFMPYPGGAADNAGTTDSGAAPTKDMYNRNFDGTPSVAPAEYGVISTGSGGGLIVHPGMTGGIRG